MEENVKEPFYQYEGDGIYYVGKHGMALDDYHTLEKEMKAELEGGENYESDWIARYEAPEGTVVKVTKIEVDWGFIDCYRVEILSVGPKDICFQSTIVEEGETYYGHDYMVFGSGNIKHEKHLKLNVVIFTQEEYDDRFVKEGPEEGHIDSEIYNRVCECHVLIVNNRIYKNLYQIETKLPPGSYVGQEEIDFLKSYPINFEKTHLPYFLDGENCDRSMEVMGALGYVDNMVDNLKRPGYIYSLAFATEYDLNDIKNLELIHKIQKKQEELLKLYEEYDKMVVPWARDLYQSRKNKFK